MIIFTNIILYSQSIHLDKLEQEKLSGTIHTNRWLKDKVIVATRFCSLKVEFYTII